MKNPGKIRNKIKRKEIYAKYKLQKKVAKKKIRDQRIKEIEELGEKAPPKQVPKTLENLREIDETTVQADDDEIVGGALHSFPPHFSPPISPSASVF